MPPDDELPTELIDESASAAPATGDGLPAGTQFGDYRIEALLGRGGMGEVYRAQQLHPVRRQVAIKRLLAGALSSQQRARFEVERQVLAHLQHPGIAQLFDAGSLADGSPYFVMEYIDGTSLTRFCQTQRLPLKARLRLFIQLLEAVQHAHQRGVIHRDLKPGNVLVSEVNGRPLAKVIDFGIASVSAGDAATPDSGAGTLPYMSPEQRDPRLGALDTRSDIFALGVLLHELLTGSRPSGLATGAAPQTQSTAPTRPSRVLAALPADHARQQAETIGLRPRQLNDLLRNELDWVVLKAIAPERDQRYPSAAAFADDLRRYLDRAPLQAHPGGSRYRLSKLFQRHRLAVLAAAGMLAVLLVGLSTALYGLGEARQQRRLAEQRQQELQQLVDFQQRLWRDIDFAQLGQQLLQLQQRQIERSPAFAALAADQQAHLQQLAALSNGTDLARNLLDQQILGRAIGLIEHDFAAQPRLAAELGESLAELYAGAGLHAQAATRFAAVAALRQAQLGASHTDTLRAELGAARARLALGEFDRAAAELNSLLERAEQTRAAPPMLHAEIVLARAESLAASGDFAGANALLDRFDSAGNARLQFLAQAQRAMNLLRLDRGDEARQLIDQALQQAMPQIDADPDWLQVLNSAIPIRALTGDLPGALALAEQLHQQATQRLGAEHPFSLTQLNNRAATLINLQRFAEAVDILRPLIETRRRVLGGRHSQTLKSIANLGSALTRWMAVATDHPQRLALLAEAVAGQREVLAARLDLLGEAHPDSIGARASLGSMLLEAGQGREAEQQLRRALQLQRQRLGPDSDPVYELQSVLADALLGNGERDAALGELQALLQGRDALLGSEHPKTIDSARRLWTLLAADDPRRNALLQRYPALARAP